MPLHQQSKVYSFATTGVFVLAARTTQNNSKTASVLDLLIADPLPELGKSGDAPSGELIGSRENWPRCPIPRGVDCSYSHPGLNSLCPGTKDFLHRRGQVSVRRWRCRPNTRKMSFPRAELLQRWIVAPTKLLVHQGPGSQVFLDHLLRSYPTGCACESGRSFSD